MRKILWFALSVLSIAVFAAFVLQENVRRNLDFFWPTAIEQVTSFFHIAHGWYYYLIYAGVIAGVAFILIRNLKQAYPYLKYPYFFLFLPAILFPILRCYFRIPYVFCRTCPRPCPWGWLRPVIIPGFLILNLHRRFWCYRLCPFGTLQDYQTQICKKRLKIHKAIINIKYLFLLTAILAFLATAYAKAWLLQSFFFTAIYHIILGAAITALVIFILSFVIPRLWCNYFCPVGTVSELVLKGEKLFPRKNQ